MTKWRRTFLDGFFKGSLEKVGLEVDLRTLTFNPFSEFRPGGCAERLQGVQCELQVTRAALGRHGCCRLCGRLRRDVLLFPLSNLRRHGCCLLGGKLFLYRLDVLLFPLSNLRRHGGFCRLGGPSGGCLRQDSCHRLLQGKLKLLALRHTTQNTHLHRYQHCSDGGRGRLHSQGLGLVFLGRACALGWHDQIGLSYHLHADGIGILLVVNDVDVELVVVVVLVVVGVLVVLVVVEVVVVLVVVVVDVVDRKSVV
jgi:hypothetical protein